MLLTKSGMKIWIYCHLIITQIFKSGMKDPYIVFNHHSQLQSGVKISVYCLEAKMVYKTKQEIAC